MTKYEIKNTTQFKKDYKLDNLISFQHLEINELSKPYTISNLSTLWEEKLNLIEEKCVPYLKIDDLHIQ